MTPLSLIFGAIAILCETSHIPVCTDSDIPFSSLKQLKLLSDQLNAILSIMASHPDSPLISTLPSQMPLHLLSVSTPHPSPASRLYEASQRHVTYWLELFALHHPDYVAAIVASRIDEHGAVTSAWSYRQLNEVTTNIIFAFTFSRVVIGLK
jgi:ferricrocin synthase